MPIQTLCELFATAVAERPRADMFRHKTEGEWKNVSTAEFHQAVQEVAQGLVSLGVEPGSRVALLSENRFEWALCDLAILACGAVVVPIYPTLMPHQIDYILGDAAPHIVFCSTAEQAEKLKGVGSRVPSVRHVVAFEPVAQPDLLSLGKVRELGAVHDRNHSGDFERRWRAVGAQDLATIIYTSGTTGDPKGVMLTHENIVSNVLAVLSAITIDSSDSCLSFLPLSHIFERMAGYYTMLHCGVSIAYAESVETVAMNLGEIRPTVMVAVPRLYEKIYARVLNTASAGSPLKRNIFFWAKGVGAEYTSHVTAGRPAPFGVKLKMKLADALVFKKLRGRTGGRLRFFVSGGAPLAQEIAEFFFAAGLTILEGYGLTETSPVISVNTFEHFRPGSVGRTVRGVEVRIAEDGEILTRSSSVMRGYYQREDATNEAIVDGWFHTGDIGHIDADGFLFITDRKKDILVTAGGKNIAPQPIENELKLNKYVTEAVVIGDKRKYLSALIVPSFENLEEYAQRKEIAHAGMKDLLGNQTIEGLFQHAVDKVNAQHPSFEQIKYFRLLDQEFTLENGELTPSLKVKRKVVGEKYKSVIESMYKTD